MKKLILIIFMFMIGFGLSAQILPFSRDHSFQLQLDSMNNFDFTKDTVFYPGPSSPYWPSFIHQKGGWITDVWEDPESGNIYIAGKYEYHHYNGNFYTGLMCFKKDGSFYENFYHEGMSTLFSPINDTTFSVSNNGGIGSLVDTLGKFVQSWTLNAHNSVPCNSTDFPFFFEDGSSLWVNRDNKAFPKHCNPRIPPDTFPHEPIVKIDAEGKFDSTFSADTDISYANFGRYDSNRIMMYAPTRFVYNYDNRPVNGVWRINHDGSLDTTFNAPISDALADGGFHRAPIVLKDGKMLLTGYFLLEGNNEYHSLVRLKPDGSLDSTFMNHSGPKDTTGTDSVAYVSYVVPTPDGGYIVAGFFNLYQGYEKNGIAKIDENGVVEPQYFTGSGPGDPFEQTATVLGIIPSAFGGYYVVGNFRSWDGQPSQPIIRLHGMYVGIEEYGQEVQELKLFPNPAKESIKFYGIGANEIEQLFLSDIQGKILEADFRETSLNTYEMNISNLKTGMYFLKIISGGEVAVGKFVKE